MSWPARQPRLLWSARRPSDNARTALDESLLHGRSPGRASRTTATTTRAHCQSLGTLQYRDSGHSPPAPQAPTGEPQEGPEALSLCCCGCRRILSAYGARRSWPSSHSSARLLHHLFDRACAPTVIKKQGASHCGRLQRWPYPRRRRWRARGRLPPQPRTGARRRREQPRAGRVAGSRPPPAKRRQRRSGGPRTRPTW